ncbi:MAG: hypothetical protein RL636_1297 [Verrucomicrobiota bacterium]
MNLPATPPPWAHLRRTRGALISVTILLGLWLALVVFLIYVIAGSSSIYAQEIWLLLALLGFVISLGLMGWKLIQLIKAAGHPDMESSPQLAARAFAAFWRTNLQAHALLWAWLALTFILAKLFWRE